MFEGCKLACSRGLQYAWVDTCCIDKASSVELTNSINSICQWHEEAEGCYAFLSGVRVDDLSPPENREVFKASIWITRGSTLQERIAPQDKSLQQRLEGFGVERPAVRATKRHYQGQYRGLKKQQGYPSVHYLRKCLGRLIGTRIV